MTKHERACLKKVVVKACNNTNKCICKNHTQRGSLQPYHNERDFTRYHLLCTPMLMLTTFGINTHKPNNIMLTIQTKKKMKK